MNYKVVEIFDSIDGEGIRSGQLVSFIRLAGCNLRCSYCDTLYALFGEEEPCRYEEMTLDEIYAKANQRFKRITLTGGEPLIAPGVSELMERFLENGFEVNVETNGAASLAEAQEKLGHFEKLFFTIDYKLPSSGETKKMLWQNFLNLRPQDVIKFVAGNEEDLLVMLDVVKKLTLHYKKMPHIYIGAVYGGLKNEDIVNFMMRNSELYDAVMQIQLHKVIWDPDRKGV